MPWRFERLAAMVAAGCLCVHASAATAWHLSRTDHFELYSQSDESAARPLLIWFEQLRAFFLQQSIVRTHDLPTVRLVVFASQAEYEQYRLRATSDAYFAAFGNRDYIAMPAGTGSEPRIAAHEFGHFVLHSAGIQLPAWLNEGLCEFFSTVRIAESASELGGEVRASSQALKRQSWIPIRELQALAADSPVREDRQSAGMFYAQSWALTQMLVLSPDYGPRFQELLAAIGSGLTSKDALATVYGVSAETIESDLRAWVRSATPRSLRVPAVVAETGRVEVSDVPSFTSRSILADLMAASGELDRAEALYRELAREIPQSADVAAALGAIALRKGNIPGAREEWKRAIEQGVTDADVCYRYAVLADMGGLAADEIRPALERAVALRPAFDDARYKLALLEKNVGQFRAAVENLRAMRTVAPARAFSYWSALSDALNELERRDEAVDAARKAGQYASTSEERAHAAQLVYLAQTDLAVEFARDANGRAQMVTTRVPHEMADRNPFVEAGDDLRRVRGALVEVDCSGGVTRIRVESVESLVTLAIPDLSRVRMRNAPEELVCGPQEAGAVLVEFAASKDGASLDGLVRGIEFQPE